LKRDLVAALKPNKTFLTPLRSK